jgi:carbon storage regulator CsrA
MLVLTRKSREAVVVGGTPCSEPVVKVTVLEISNGRVRLGFEAAKSVAVHRWEVWERANGEFNRPPPDAAPVVG